MRGKVILISGASSGIGRRTAAYLAEQGAIVYGTSRCPTAPTLDGFTLLPLDVTDEASVRGCVDEVVRRAGRLDVVIANAGIDLFGALEETPIALAQQVFDVNFFGAARLVQAALPVLRAQFERGGRHPRPGQIILVGSALGRAAWPFEGYYCASKFALEGYAEALCYEMNLFGIAVSSVQPGFFKSAMIHKQLYAPPLSVYTNPRAYAHQLGEMWSASAPDPLPVAQTIARIIRARWPALRYAVGLEAHLSPPLAQLLPLSARFKVGRWLLGVDDPRRDAARAGLLAAAGLAILGAVRRLAGGRRKGGMPNAADEL